MNQENAVRQQVPTITQALKALDAMERQLTEAKTYDQIRKVIKEAIAIKVLLGDVEAVKIRAEDAVLAGSLRIGEEIKKVPKASKGQLPHAGKSTTGIPHTSRSRLTMLAEAGPEAVKEAAIELRNEGKDVTPRAVATLLTQGNKQERRAERERALGTKQMAMPDKRYGVIYADPPWRFEPYSRESGMDRAADNHYPTMETEEIAKLAVPAAADCVLFLWATVPMLEAAMSVIPDWGFKYKSHFVWVKDKTGKGHWNQNKHELLLVATRGTIPAPAPGQQWPSAITASRGKHSSKPSEFRTMIEELFPTLPKIELFASERHKGWGAWGNEVELSDG
jgi:N6-adenosine-specific RNA methylase IME4